MFLLFVILVLSFYVAFLFLKARDPSSKKLPPGPWGIPLLGHLLLLGTSPHRKLLAWKKDYGPIMTIRFGSFQTVVLNDVKLIKEAFNLPAFAGRGQIKWVIDATKNRGFSWCEGPQHAEQRQFVMKNLKDFGYGRTIEAKIHEEILDLVNLIRDKIKENKLLKINGIFTAGAVNTFWSIAVGERFKLNDPQIHHFAYLVAEKIARTDTFIGKLAMFLPWISKVVPKLTGYNEKIACFDEVYDYVQERISQRRTTWVKGQPRDLTDAYLDKVDDTSDLNSTFHASKNSVVYSISDLLLAAVETTNTTLEWSVNLLARHPQVQQKLQEEIDLVVGSDRLPSLSDRPRMPYSDAIVHEIGRYASVIPLGVFRRTLEDVDLRGYHIPKGTMIIGHTFGVHFDEDVVGDPENFRPERFLQLSQEKDRRKDEFYMPFSTGKRSCPGEGLSKDQLFLFITSLFQNFNMRMPEGAAETKEFFGLTLQPHPFELEVRERGK